MSLREKLNGNPSIVAGVAGAVLLIAVVVVLLWWLRGGGTYTPYGGQRWYYDTGARALFIDSEARVPPFDHGGNVAVRAEVGSCGSCDDEAARKVLWLERYTEAARPLMEQYVQARLSDNLTAEALEAEAQASEGLEVRDVDDPTWWAYHTPRAVEIRSRMDTLCDGQPARFCSP